MARATGNPVEDVSQRTETESVFANPDGTWQAEIHSAPQWVRAGGNGKHAADWVEPDRVLDFRDDGSVAPRAHVNGIVLSGGGSTDVVLSERESVSGAVIEVLWDGSNLPKPQLDGGRATYKNVYPGVDLVFDILPEGFESFFVVKTKAALKSAPDLALEFRVVGAEVVEDGLGGFDIVGLDGLRLGHSPGAFAWDASTDDARTMSVLGAWEEGPHDPGRQLEGLPLAPDVVQGVVNEAADSGLVSVTDSPVIEGNRVKVGLGLPEEWVESSSTVFPIVIDPSASLSGPYWDTYVRYNDTSNYSSSSDLLIGTANDGTNRYRTFITWNVSTMKGRDVTWAGMYLYMYHAWSCNARNWTVYDIGGETVTQSRYWATQPTSEHYGPYSTTLSTTRGYENGGCTNGWVGVNVTSSAIRWSDFPSGSNLATVAVRADSETDNYYWKRFYSSETSYDPYVSYTYNQTPATPTAVSIDGTALTTDVTLTSEQVADGVLVSTTVTDPDGGEVQALFTVKQNGIVIIDSLPGSKVTSGNVSSVTLPYVLASNVNYTIEVRVTDTRSISEAFAPEYTFHGPVVTQRDLSPEWDDETGVA